MIVTKRIYNIIYVMFALLVALIIFNNVLPGVCVSYVAQKTFVMPYPEIMLVAFLMTLVMVVLGRRRAGDGADDPYLLILLCVGLFLLQFFLAKHTLFITRSWDAGRVLTDVYRASVGRFDLVDKDYYSYYPNNRGIFLLEYIVCKFLKLTGTITIKRALLAMVGIESAISAVTAYFVYRVVRKVTVSTRAAYVAWGIYALILGLSGWVIIPYTDMTVIAFPVLIYYLYLKMDDSRMDYVRWFFIFLLTVIGFFVKPTVAIMLIAILLCGLVTWLPIMISHLKGKNKRLVLGRLAAVLFLGIVTSVCVSCVFSIAVEATGLTIDRQKDTGPLHMLMMGLNDSNDGAMTWEDIAYSQSFETKEARTKGQLQRIEGIMKAYDPGSFLSHLSRKALVVFNDGTFAWGEEGGFFDQRLTYGSFDEGLREITYNEGRYYSLFSSFFQMLWYMVLTMLLFVTAIPHDERHMIPVVSVLGIIIFNMLFEARARYLIVYAPMIIIVAVLGLEAMWKKKRDGWTTLT